MTYIEFEDVAISFFDKNLYTSVNLQINKGDKIVLLGENGAGKSTFIKMITGDETGYSGNISIQDDLKISVLNQFFPIKEDLTVTQLLEKPFEKTIAIENEMDEIANKLALISNESDNFEEVLEEYNLKCAEFESVGGYDYLTIVQKFVKIFNLDKILDRQFSTLSGGEKQHLRLAITIFDDVDLIILDEPITFFDKPKTKWLTNFIKESEKTFLIVCHEENFVEAVANKIFDIENKIIVSYDCDYDNYISEKKEYFLKLEEENKEYDEKIELKNAALNKKIKWMEIAENKHHHAVTIRRLTREVEKLEKEKFVFTDKTEYDYVLKNSKDENIAEDECWIKFTNVSLDFADRNIYKNVNFTFNKNQRVVISGDNGAGKTTFIRLILGKETPTTGDIYVNEKIVVGYIPQDVFFEDENVTVIDYCKKICRIGDILMEEYIDLLFDNDADYRIKRLYMLSGGESKRLQILSHILLGADLLLLDEPTTFMDDYSKFKLRETLKGFSGGIVLITHDINLIRDLEFKRYRVENNRFNVN